MQYRVDKRSGNKLSVLGFGCMRFPGGMGRPNKEKTEKLLLQAVNGGVNYYDTAYMYPGSEEVIGEIFEKHKLRKKVYIATKLPHCICNAATDFDRLFDEQKRRLRSKYVDYYSMHNFTDLAHWERLCQIGIETWITDKKKSGEIRQIGFSYHGSFNEYVKLLNAYDWDFVMIQYNYLNEHYQAGVKGLHFAAERDLPVFIMEPLLGGKLAAPPKECVNIFQKARSYSTPVSWAFNWLWNQSEVTVLLSGMNEISQLDENMKLASSSEPGMLNSSDMLTVQKAAEVINKTYKIHCTGCNYCMPCPEKISIPDCMAAYNASYAIGWITGFSLYLNTVGIASRNQHYASDCTQCGICEKKCPQEIAVRKEMKRIKRRLQIPGTKFFPRIMRAFVR